MSTTMKSVRYSAFAGIGIVLGAGCLCLLGIAPLPWRAAAADTVHDVPAPPPLAVELVKDAPHTLVVPEDVRKSLGILKGKTEAVAGAQLPTRSLPLVLPGSTALDPTRLMRIRARFAPARVVEIAPVRDESASTQTGQTVMRELRAGDKVKKGDLLGVFYSSDVGNKKNDLIDALVQLRMDEEILEKGRKAFLSGALPEVFMLNVQRNVEADRNAERRAVSTLQVWDIPEEDIKAVYDEAIEIGKRKGKRDPEKDKLWPRVELRAPDDGIIVERNVTQHEMVVDNTINLFQVAKVTRLVVLANAPEDDLPTLLKLQPDQRRWTIQTVGTGPGTGIPGVIDEVSYLIDINQHTAVLKGHIENPDERFRAGQFVSARIDLPPPEDVVEVPIGAIVDDGKQCVVFVQSEARKEHYTLRRVQVTHRFDRTAFVRSQLSEAEMTLSPAEKEDGLLPRQPLKVNERVLTAGVLELKKELEDQESNAAK